MGEAVGLQLGLCYDERLNYDGRTNRVSSFADRCLGHGSLFMYELLPVGVCYLFEGGMRDSCSVEVQSDYSLWTLQGWLAGAGVVRMWGDWYGF